MGGGEGTGSGQRRTNAPLRGLDEQLVRDAHGERIHFAAQQDAVGGLQGPVAGDDGRRAFQHDAVDLAQGAGASQQLNAQPSALIRKPWPGVRSWRGSAGKGRGY